MENDLQSICIENGLNTVSVMFQNRFAEMTVYLHWDDDAGSQCCSGFGKTFDEALIGALAEMAIVRVDREDAPDEADDCDDDADDYVENPRRFMSDERGTLHVSRGSIVG